MSLFPAYGLSSQRRFMTTSSIPCLFQKLLGKAVWVGAGKVDFRDACVNQHFGAEDTGLGCTVQSGPSMLTPATAA